MTRRFGVAALVVLTIASLAAGVSAQTAQAPAGQSAPAQSPSGGQGQITSDATSQEAQMQLARGVMHALLMLPYYGVFDNLGFRLQGRTVILEGQVLRSSLKPDAERAVKKVEGVDNVVNKIEVLPPGPMDEQLRIAVRDAIYNYGPLFKYKNPPIPPIRIIVKNSRVTLEGVVDNETDKGLCTLRANQVPNALSVTNNLRVVSPK
jgi:hyperosmotically inducible protein